MYKTVLVFSFKIYSNKFYSIIKILNTTFLSFTTLKSKIALENSRVGNFITDYCTLHFRETLKTSRGQRLIDVIRSYVRFPHTFL